MNAASNHCPDCGFAQASHAALWFSNSLDVVTLAWSPIHIVPFSNFFVRASETVADAFGLIAFLVGRAFGIITLSDDMGQTHSNRSKLIWREAARRGLSVRQIFVFGKSTDTFTLKICGRTRFFKSLPLAPLKVETLRMDDKIWFKQRMVQAGLPVPRSYGVSNLRGAERALGEFGIVCVKPRSGSNGRHTYPYVKTKEDLAAALKSVRQVCAFASIEEHLEGNLCRATCVDGCLVGFLESRYPTVIGDGISSIRGLIAELNATRPEGIAEIAIDATHEGYISRRGYALDAVLPEGIGLPLTYRAGASSGGSNLEHGRNIHLSFVPIIERAAKLTELSVVGFDLIIPDPLLSADRQRWGFIEANSLPWTDLHATPFEGEPIDLSPFVWDAWLTAHPSLGIR